MAIAAIRTLNHLFEKTAEFPGVQVYHLPA
jgi:hypothetical protein